MALGQGCRGRNEKGEPCRAPRVRGSDHCVFHDPDHAETVQQARSAGGQRRKREVTLAVAYDFRGISTVEDIQRLLEVAAFDALGLENNIVRVRALSQICQVGLSVLDKGELEERLASIEASRPSHCEARVPWKEIDVSIATRLDRITPVLSGRQRAILAMRSIAAGQEPDRELWRIDDEHERRAFNRCMARFYVANTELGMVLDAIRFHLDRVAEDNTFELLREASEMAARDLGEPADLKNARRWRSKREVTVPEFLLGVAEDVRARMLARLLLRAAELRAVEDAWEELAHDFGEPILAAEVRESADAAWERLRE